jgi:hypothetical protein
MIFIALTQLNTTMGGSIINHPVTRLTTKGLLKKYIIGFSLILFCNGVMANAPLASKQQIGTFYNG